ncbi:hypothetical protein SS50377_21538 [Spironucleus salmonicida]|uniref:Uncharacterized protein n=3 Tax=Spironucleus salmonicida TaxID=348837 RepID=A0A9P8LX79_9EUKA|nr:hypothetical protein SS50377_21538 [Spironucleus salmonicida]
MLFLLAVNINQTFNAYQTVRENCYTDDTAMTYNRNINQITVALRPTLNPACFALPRGIEAQLMLKNDKVPILSRVLTDFSYANTTEIVFTLAATFDTETFAVLTLFSYSEITQTHIFVFDEQKSALDQCYAVDSTLEVNATSLNLTVTPTGLCSQQIETIKDATDTTLVLNDLTQVNLNLMGTVIAMKHADFASSYATKTAKVFTITVDEAVLQGFRQEALPTATISFVAQQGVLAVTFTHTVGTVSLRGLDLSSLGADLSFYHPNYVVLGLWDGAFLTRVENHPDFDTKLLDLYNKQTFTSYVLRLTGVLDGEVLSLQTTVVSRSYEAHTKVRRFTCTQGSMAEQEACARFHQRATQTQAAFVYDTLFYNGNAFVFGEEVRLYEVPSCWKSAVMQRGGSQLCVQLITGGNLDVCGSVLPEDAVVQTMLTFQFMNLETDENFSLPKFYVQQSIQLSRRNDQYCIDCDALAPTQRGYCYANKQMLAESKGNVYANVMFDSEDPAYFFMPSGLVVVTRRTSNFDYTGQHLATFLVGGAFIAACVVMTVMGIVQVVKTVRRARHSKKK